MKFFKVRPEVPGSIGERSRVTYENGVIKEIHDLHFEFDGWLGDELVTSYPLYLMTEELANQLLETDLTGYIIKDAEISQSDIFDELQPDTILPNFKWLIPVGKLTFEGTYVQEWSGHDICLGNYGVDLFFTERAYAFFQQFQLSYCKFTEYNGDF